jgi:CBS domain-containing protein
MEIETAAGLMQPAVTVLPEASLEECAQLLRAHKVRYLPVVDTDRRMLAMVTDQEVFELGGFVRDTWVPFDVASTRLTAESLGHYASPEIQRDTPASRVLELLAGPSDALVVVNVKGRVTGIITEDDGVRFGTIILPTNTKIHRTNCRPVVTVSPATPGRTVLDRMLTERIRHVVIEDEGRPVGVLSFRDLIVAGIAWGRSLSAGELATSTTVHVVTEGSRLRYAAAQMAGREIGCLPVVDSSGQVVSIVTRTDICVAAAEAVFVPDPYAEWPTQRLASISTTIPRLA